MKIIKGIIIKISNYDEKSTIVYILNNQKLYLIKFLGINKVLSKNRHLLFISNVISVKIIYKGINQKIYMGTEASIIKNNFEIFLKNNKYYYIWCFFTNLLINFVNLRNVSSAYTLFTFIINDMKKNYEKTVSLLFFYTLKLLNIFNYKFILNFCVNCKNKKNIIFLSLNEGGVLCRNCNKNKELDDLRFIYNFLHFYNKNQYSMINSVLFSNIEYTKWINKKFNIFFQNILAINFPNFDVLMS